MNTKRGDDRQSNNSYDNNSQDNNPVLTPPDPDKVWELSTTNNANNANNDEEILRNTTYRFHLPVQKLINNSEDTRLARSNRKKETKKVPRRQNAWILYRRDKSASPEFQGLKSALISKKIAAIWNKEPRETRVLFEALSNMSTKVHKEKYGNDYVYKPSKPKGRSKKKKETTTIAKPTDSHSTSIFSANKNLSEQRSPTTSSLEEESVYPTPTCSPFEEDATTFSSSPGSPYLNEASASTSESAFSPTLPLPYNALGLTIPMSDLNLPEFFAHTPNDCFLGQELEFFPNVPNITITPTPLSLGYENDVLMDIRDNFFSAPPSYYEGFGDVCDLSQIYDTQYYEDWTLYPANTNQIVNPREIEETQFSDDTSY